MLFQEIKFKKYKVPKAQRAFDAFRSIAAQLTRVSLNFYENKIYQSVRGKLEEVLFQCWFPLARRRRESKLKVLPVVEHVVFKEYRTYQKECGRFGKLAISVVLYGKSYVNEISNRVKIFIPQNSLIESHIIGDDVLSLLLWDKIFAKN